NHTLYPYTTLFQSHYLWDFGDGSTSTEYEPSHTYNDAGKGSFDVSLIAYNDLGCSDTLKMDAAIQVLDGGRLLIPNAFTPSLSGPGNTGGHTHVFMPLMQGITECQLMVSNRRGGR